MGESGRVRLKWPGIAVRRIRERSEAARRAVFERNGLLDIAVPSIRALRGGDEQ
jgi:hypothetical protein